MFHRATQMLGIAKSAACGMCVISLALQLGGCATPVNLVALGGEFEDEPRTTAAERAEKLLHDYLRDRGSSGTAMMGNARDPNFQPTPMVKIVQVGNDIHIVALDDAEQEKVAQSGKRDRADGARTAVRFGGPVQTATTSVSKAP